MEKEPEENIKIKIAISLRRLLKSVAGSSDIASYNKIALNSDIRKATVSDVFNAKRMPAFSTVASIVNSMGFSMSDFAKEYDMIKDSDKLDW